ncbi:MAG: MBL fold metallo-hydrolase, partial [bacterium]
VPADHSSGCPVEEGKPNVEGGSAVGFVFRGEFGSVYVSGDTGVFADMGTIRELYAPELGVIPIDGHFNMGPYEAAYACELLGIQRVFPYHWGTFPLLKGTPAELQEHLKARGSRCEVLDVSPGGSVPLGHL